MSKRILLINNESRISGAEKSLLELLEGLPADRYSITVALPEKGSLYTKLAGRFRVELFPMKKLTREKNPFRLLLSLTAIVRTGARMARFAKKQEIDLVYANGIQAQLYGTIIRLLSGKKTIWHVRDRTPGFLISRCCALAAHRIICISKYIEKQTPGPQRKKRLVYNGLDPNLWQPSNPMRQTQQKPQPEPHQEPTIQVGIIGQLIPWKGHRDLIEAAPTVIEHHSGVHFLIIGDDITGHHQQYIQELKQLLKTKNLEQKFTFTGFIDDAPQAINRLDILAHCASGEPFGRVIIEAMALEKAVVAYRSGGCVEIIQDNINGLLVEPGNPAALAQALIALVGDNDKRIKMGKQARQHVIEKFNLGETIARIRQFIEEP